ncbi:TolC family protein [Psychrobacter sp. CAL346-MNA-CIBAN-0220]|uniref:TolC family protein n=1 Tax=Psychrobacter sp. CAL346-MNA-CIBAN-0220 TaxID=3140457 RepID=UPI003334A62D
MKCALSFLPTAMLATLSLGFCGSTLANTDTARQSDKHQNMITPVATTQIFDTNVNNYDKNSLTVRKNAPDIAQKNSLKLDSLIDPITRKRIDNSYSLEVASFLSLEQAQDILLQVSPKLAANQAAIASSEYQTAALKTLDNPFVFAQVSANAYTLQEDIDLSTLKNEVISGINNTGADAGSGIPPIPALPALPNFGELVGDRIPDSYAFKRSGSRAGAGVGVVWPVYTAGRSTALTGISDARTQEAVADSILDKNELYNTLIERYFKAQLAIIAAYLREDAYDTLQQTDHMAQRLFEEGFIARIDRLEAQSALADAKSEAINANNDARLAMIALQRLLRTDYRIKPTTPLFVSSRPLTDVSYFQELALNHHPGLQKVAAKRAQAQQLHALSDTGYKPTVMLYGFSQIDEKPSWVAGVSASWKLWGGLDKTASLASSTAKIRQADLSEIEVSDNLLLLVEKNWHDVNNAQSRYQALQSNVDLAAEVLRLRRLGLQEGVNTTVEIVQSQTQYLKARTEQAQAANSYVQALAALMQSCGTPLAFNAYLNAADIRLPTLYSE